MFKALKEKVSNEYEKAKVNIQSQALNLVNNGAMVSPSGSTNEIRNELTNKSETPTIDSFSKKESNLLNDNSSNYSEPGFSLVDLNDENSSSKAAMSSSTQKTSNTDNDSFFRTKFFSNMVNNFVPQSDIESEYESETGYRNVENISKEQLIDLCYRYKERGKKYRERWNEVVKAYRISIDEKEKLKNVLSETQDRALRRVNELKEQCNLEQEAKRHLEQSLQVVIEEKDEEVQVLRTKIELMKTTHNNDENSSLIDLNVNNESYEEKNKKVENLEMLLSKCNETLKSCQEKIDVLGKENEHLLQYKSKSEQLEKEVENVKRMRDSASKSFSESKQKLHDELESRSIIIKELKDQIEKRNIELKHRNSELKSKNEAIKTLNEKSSKIESAFENEKTTLKDEFEKEKSAAINLVRQEYEKKLQTESENFGNMIKALSEENERLKTTGTTLNSEIQTQIDERDRKIESIIKEKDEVQQQLDKINIDLKEETERNKIFKLNHEQEISSLQFKLDENDKTLEQYKLEIEQLNKKQIDFDTIKEKLETCEKLLADANVKYSELLVELDTTRKELQNKDSEIEQIRQEMNVVQQSNSNENSEIIQELESKIETLKEKNREKINKINEFEKMIVMKDTELIELSKSKNELQNEIDQLNEKLTKNSSVDNDYVNKLKLEMTKLEKVNEVTKKLITKLKEENCSIQQEINLLKQNNIEMTDEKSRLIVELEDVGKDMITFKNRLFDIFYNAYAGGEHCDISSMDYVQFLSRVEEAHKKTILENENLSQKISQLESLIQNANVSSEEDRLIQSRHVKELESTNLSLIEEIEKLRKVEGHSKQLENVLDEKIILINSLNEKVDTSNVELLELRDNIKNFKLEIKEKDAKIDSNKELITQQSTQIAAMEAELNSVTDKMDNAQQESEQNKQLKKQLNDSDQRIKQLEEDFKNSNTKYSTLSRQFEELNQTNNNNVQEMNKIKTNTKGIIELKQSLDEKLKVSENKIKVLKNDNGELIEKNKQLQKHVENLTNKFNESDKERNELKKAIEQLKAIGNEHQSTESEMKNRLKELEVQIEKSKTNSESIIREMEAKIRLSNERCNELEEKLRMKNNEDQDLRTQIIVLEEKLKQTNRLEKELREDQRINDEVSNNLKEQVHKYLNEINELKTQMETAKHKHEQTVDKLYKQLEVRESQLDESLMNANSQYNLTAQDLIKAKTELTRLNKLVDELSSTNHELENRLANQFNNQDEIHQKMVKQYELQIETLQMKLDEQKQEIAEKMDQYDNIESKLVSDHKKLINQMENEISEKNAALEEVHEYYQQRMKNKDNELKHLHEQLTSSDKNNYQINALQNSILQYHEENSRLKEIINSRIDKTGGDNKSSANSDLETCAILGVHLPQPTEYEYLRNILFEFMMGREPLTLAKVIAAVMRFSNEQTDQIIRKQEALQHNIKFNKPS